MNTLHYVKHPTLHREGLHLKRLAVKNDEDDISAGYMEASLPRQDGRYVLKLVYDPKVPAAPAENLGGSFFINERRGRRSNCSSHEKTSVGK